MLSIASGRETSYFRAGFGSSCFFVLRGRAEILRLRGVLTELCELCGQTGAMDYLEYFLTLTENLKKIPYLVLMASRPDLRVSEIRAEDIRGAVLIYEYRLLGFGCSLFTTGDFNGSRTVIAPAALRQQVSAAVCRHLMERGAQIVLLNLELSAAETCQTCFENAMAGERKRWWTTRTREAGATLALQDTLEATLATMGKHTRRNFRYYRRRAEAELDYSFVPDAKSGVTMKEMIELNRASDHPVSRRVLERRLRTLQSMEGFFCVGLRKPSGEWISLLAGRRHHGVTEVDWQLNRGGLARYSVGTLIRSYLMEYEIAIGTERLYFEGGTPHTMRYSFLGQQAMDIVVMNRSPFVFLVRRCARWLRPERNFLLQTLLSPAVKWQLR
jgi:hypothetical protein